MMDTMEKSPPPDGFDGYYDTWRAVSLGTFLQFLVDSGDDAAVVFRVTDETKPDEDGNFKRTVELVLLPNGYVLDHLRDNNIESAHEILASLIKAGIVR